jgi:hypothetical protein
VKDLIKIHWQNGESCPEGTRVRFELLRIIGDSHPDIARDRGEPLPIVVDRAEEIPASIADNGPTVFWQLIHDSATGEINREILSANSAAKTQRLERFRERFLRQSHLGASFLIGPVTDLDQPLLEIALAMPGRVRRCVFLVHVLS